MFKKKHTSGFTLIELLVVIAIIGILSAVVLASLNTARAKGADAAVKSDLTNMKSQAAIYYDNASPNSYGDAFGPNTCDVAPVGTMFTDDAKIQSAIVNAANVGGGGMVETRCSTDGTAYAVSSMLKTSGYWCVDSAGISKVVPDNTWTGVACP